MALRAVVKSGNRKLGPMAATYRTSDSCPDTCPFRNNGCYADGRIFAIANRFGEAEKKALTELFKRLPKNGMVRHHVSGDLVTKQGKIDQKYMALIRNLALKHPDVRHILYTHAWQWMSPDDLPFVVNASCETEEEIEQAVARGFEAVVTVQENDPLLGQTVAGKKVIQCPQEYKPGVTCASCQLCSRHRKSVVAFVVHGPGKKRAAQVVEEKRTWIQHWHLR